MGAPDSQIRSIHLQRCRCRRKPLQRGACVPLLCLYATSVWCEVSLRHPPRHGYCMRSPTHWICFSYHPLLPLPATSLTQQEDKKRMISFFEASLRDEAKRSQEAMDPEICDKLRSMINLTESFQAPIDGIDGLLGQCICVCAWKDNCREGFWWCNGLGSRIESPAQLLHSATSYLMKMSPQPLSHSQSLSYLSLFRQSERHVIGGWRRWRWRP